MQDNANNLRIDVGEIASGQPSPEIFSQDIDRSNLIDGRPVCYLVGEKDISVPSNSSFLGVISCSNITAANLSISNSSTLVVNSSRCSIKNCSILRAEYGIYLRNCTAFHVLLCQALFCETGFMASGSREGRFEKDLAKDCSKEGFRAEDALGLRWIECSAIGGKSGISLMGSRLCTIQNCSALGNREEGMLLSSSHKCSLLDNSASSNDKGIQLTGSNSCTLQGNNASRNQADGISLQQITGGDVLDNTAQENGQGIFTQSAKKLTIKGNRLHKNSRYGLRMSNSLSCNVTDNSLMNNRIAGANLVDCSSNILYHNIFENNAIQNAADNGNNLWDGGPILGGNFWSDHAVTGNPSHEPHQIPASGTDHYPFQDPRGWL
jgi:parallel beta-helix repeat protein